MKPSRSLAGIAGIVAIATLISKLLMAQWQAGIGKLRPRFDVHSLGVREAIAIMAPATLSSGMTQINIYVDLFFASYIPQAAAALSYAGLLAQTPKGIFSS